jgi:hypothetical protein
VPIAQNSSDNASSEWPDTYERVHYLRLSEVRPVLVIFPGIPPRVMETAVFALAVPFFDGYLSVTPLLRLWSEYLQVL